MVSAEPGWHRPWPYLLQAHFLLTHLQFADTPGNLPSSMNLSHLLGLQKNISVLLAYQ